MQQNLEEKVYLCIGGTILIALAAILWFHYAEVANAHTTEPFLEVRAGANLTSIVQPPIIVSAPVSLPPARPEITVTKLRTSTGDIVRSGETVTIQIEVTNSGTMDLDRVSLQDSYHIGCMDMTDASTPPDRADKPTVVESVLVRTDQTGIATQYWDNIGPLAMGESKVINTSFLAKIVDTPLERPYCMDAKNMVMAKIVMGDDTSIFEAWDSAKVNISDGIVRILYVDPFRGWCNYGIWSGPCLQVSETIDGPRVSLDGPIMGIHFLEGMAYKVQMLSESNPTPLLADDIEARHTLLALLEETDISALDDDDDGTPNGAEAHGPNNGDGNGDSIPDYQQANVISALNPMAKNLTSQNSASENYVTAVLDGDCTTVNAFKVQGENASGVIDTEFDYPLGIVGVDLACDQPGQSATISYYFHTNQDPSSLTFRKYGPTIPGDNSTIAWYDYPAVIETAPMLGGVNTMSILKATITITDGQLGDDTGMDGRIVDPGGVAGISSGIEILKELNTSGPLRPTAPLSFKITITNTSNSLLTSLPMTDTYDTNYLSFNSVLGASIAPNDNGDDGQLNWANLLASSAGLAPGAAVSVVVNFTALDATENATGCTSGAGYTCNTATVRTSAPPGTPSTVSSTFDILIEPAEGKYDIGDVVWHDINNNGTQDANEPGINGVLVHLYEDEDGNGTISGGDTYVISTTTTISSGVGGFYQFEKVATGKTFIVQLDPANFDPGGPLAGFTVSDNVTNPTQYTQFVPAVAGDVDTIDFGLYCRFDLALIKTLATGEVPTISAGEDVTFTLTILNQGAVAATDISLVDYLPSGFTLSPNDTDGWTSNGVTATIDLSGTLGPGLPAAVNIRLTAGTNLSGTVTNAAEIADASSNPKDLNGNSYPDADSVPDTTDGNGPGESDNLEDDQVNEDPNDPITPGDEDDHDVADILVLPLPQFGDRVWIDPDGDGLASTSAPMPIAGLVITATSPTGVFTTTTNADGIYSFTVPADTYVVTYGPVPPIYGTVVPSGTPGGNSESGNAGDYQEPGNPDESHENGTTVTLNPGEENWHVDFAFTPPPVQFGDRVWVDSNDDGLASTGVITPVVGLVITATGLTDVFTTTTNAEGYYSFTVPAGTYVVGYGPLPALYGVLIPSSAPGGNIESGNAGSYQEAGKPDESHTNNTTVALLAGEENWHVDFAFTLAPVPMLAVSKTINGEEPFGVGETISYTIRITNTGNVTITVLPLEDHYNNAFMASPTASVSRDNFIPGTLRWNDLTTTLGDVAPGGSVSLLVSFTTLADTSLLVPVAPCVENGQMPNVAEVRNAKADPNGDDGNPNNDYDVVSDADDIDCAEAQVLSPTGVLLAERSISQTSEGVMIRWSTVNETSIMGFNMWKSNGVNAKVRSDEIIIAKSTGQSSGANYEWLDAGATLTYGDIYVLELVKIDGSTERTVIDVSSASSVFLPFLAQ